VATTHRTLEKGVFEDLETERVNNMSKHKGTPLINRRCGKKRTNGVLCYNGSNPSKLCRVERKREGDFRTMTQRASKAYGRGPARFL